MPKTGTATAAQAAPPSSPARFELLPLERIDENPRNPRKYFDTVKLHELADSIREHGVVEPILVRPKGDRFEIVFGARRYRASKLAEQSEIPAIVRTMADVDALETTVIENLQRADVHPLEEAEGYEQLLNQKDRIYTVDDLAAKVGKSKAYVYARMKLLALCPEARKAFYDGMLTASVALLVARMPGAELQKKAIVELERCGEPGDPVSFRSAAAVIHRDFMLELGRAYFDRTDETLLPTAGPCTSCPKRSGNQPDLFGDVASADVCSDPSCFKAKTEAAWERRAEEARAAGRKVLSEKENKASFSYSSLRNDAYVDLAAQNYNDPKYRTWKQLIGKLAKAHVVLGRDERGDVHELVPAAEARKLMKEAGHNFKAERAGRSGVTTTRSSPAEIAREKEAAAIRNATEDRIRLRVLEALTQKQPNTTLWRLVIDELRLVDDGVVEARWPAEEKEGSPAYEKRVEAEIAKLGDDELRGLALGLALGSALPPYGGNAPKLLKWTGVDAKKVEAEVKAERKAAAAAKPETPPAPAQKKGARRG